MRKLPRLKTSGKGYGQLHTWAAEDRYRALAKVERYGGEAHLPCLVRYVTDALAANA